MVPCGSLPGAVWWKVIAMADTRWMGELQVGEEGLADRRPATGPVERERVGQASIDWKESGSAERVNYNEEAPSRHGAGNQHAT